MSEITIKFVYNFQKFQTVRSFGESIYNYEIISEVDKKTNLVNIILEFDNKARSISKADKKKKAILLKE